eukprot:COSAG01_NODE_4406_length_5056_cov_124.577365_1_plen_81_part_10
MILYMWKQPSTKGYLGLVPPAGQVSTSRAMVLHALEHSRQVEGVVAQARDRVAQVVSAVPAVLGAVTVIDHEVVRVGHRLQ